ncbi:hypothetical protein P9112_003182 [Eukaryota sp. TZLM1-RC]
MSLVSYNSDSSSDSEVHTEPASPKHSPKPALPSSLRLSSSSFDTNPPVKLPRQTQFSFGLDVASHQVPSRNLSLHSTKSDFFDFTKKSRQPPRSPLPSSPTSPTDSSGGSLRIVKQSSIAQDTFVPVMPGQEAWGGARGSGRSVSKEARQRGHISFLVEKAKQDAPRIALKKQEQQMKKGKGHLKPGRL